MPYFRMEGPDAETYARQAFVRHCHRLVDGTISPSEFCRVINPIEQLFDFPVWLAAFYDYCDWCEPESMRSAFQHLVEYAKRYLGEQAA